MWDIIVILAFLFAVIFCIGASGSIKYIDDHGINLVTAWNLSGILFNPMIGILASVFSGSLQVFLTALIIYDMVVPMGFLFYKALT